MAKVPKHRRIKRATVLIKRTTHCIRSTKNKTFSPLYKQLKVNNHSLAKALSQEKQESQLLFLRNNELKAEVQDLVHACNTRDLVITNVLKNAKDMMQILVTMSGFLTNTISSCQEFVQNQGNIHRLSTSSTGRRESTKRLSTKSPARGVVKPMVSGHTITKPTINLSRVNMQRLQNQNLSIIEEGPTTPERNLDRSVESRRSRTLPERLSVATLRPEEDEERVIVNRRTNRFSSGRLSGRYSKRNSGRLSGAGLSSRLSKRSSEFPDVIKSPRVALQDVSRYLSNNQSVNIRLLSETTHGNHRNVEAAIVEDTRLSEQSSSPDSSAPAIVIPETQEFCETTDSEQDSSQNATAIRDKRSKNIEQRRSSNSNISCKKQLLRSSRQLESETIDPLEGSSWMHHTTIETTSPTATTVLENNSSSPSSEEQDEAQTSSEMSFNKTRRNSSYQRTSRLPKMARLNESDDFTASAGLSRSNGLEASNRFVVDDDDDEVDDHQVNRGFITQRRGPAARSGTSTHSRRSINNGVDNNVNDDDDNDDDDHRVNLGFISVRRGPSVRSGSTHYGRSANNHVVDDDDDDDDDDTLMLNIQRQVRAESAAKPTPPTQSTSAPQPDRPSSQWIPFDINELLKLTPLKPLMDMMGRNNEMPALADADPESEPTITTQLTQRCPRPIPYRDDIETEPTLRVNPTQLSQAIAAVTRHQAEAVEAGTRDRSMYSMTTDKIPSRIELPRLTEMLNMTEDVQAQSPQSNQPPTPENKPLEVQKRKRTAPKYAETHSASEDNVEEPDQAHQKVKKRKQRKGRQTTADKDPSAAKVVLEKLNDSRRSAQNETVRSERKNYDESSSSVSNSLTSRADHLSDSESSTASTSSKQMSTRPRRQKAPVTLQEPSLRKKMRR